MVEGLLKVEEEVDCRVDSVSTLTDLLVEAECQFDTTKLALMKNKQSFLNTSFCLNLPNSIEFNRIHRIQ